MSFLSDLFSTTTNTNSNSNTATSGQSNSTASQSSTPTFSPQLQQMMNQLLSYSASSMSNPMQMLAPIQNAGLQSINQSFASVPSQVAQQMASRGYGSSGSAGDAMYNANLARSGAVSNFQGQISSDAINQMNNGASLGEQLLNTGKGTSSTGTSSGTTSGTADTSGSSTTTTSGLGNILSSLSSLLMLSSPSSGGGETPSLNSETIGDLPTTSNANLYAIPGGFNGGITYTSPGGFGGGGDYFSTQGGQ
jgi:hypothetical protein